ncbi:hypothetical protein BCR42DRAFT_373138 [Absidia repens]|uniref:Zn(2)-C6 fungal-type domain-containing protein n=1 Tax=Absidia repens TaxID=90262 RepID=A0A1X2IJP5_9FUNG|nr:hypothetical protein BCR42DRAFT_373138 [Absidia repens]
MSPSSLPKTSPNNKHPSVDRHSTIRACEPCRRRKRSCNGQKPCSLCTTEANDCVYSVVSDHPRGVFTTNTARRLSSGSACETCRRRKTKCDGSNPCAFCAANNLTCINNAERRKRVSISTNSSLLSTSPASPSSLSTISSLSSTTPSNTNSSLVADHQTMDRIEDRLRRIEQLMTVFTPSPLSQTTTFYPEEAARRRRRSTYRSIPPSSAHFIRQQRHSIQGIAVEKEQIELQLARRAISSSPPSCSSSSSSSSASSSSSPSSSDAGAYITPPNSGGKKRPLANMQYYQKQPLSSVSPPLSPEPTSNAMIRQSSLSNNPPLTSSMLNLTLSPSSSTSSHTSSFPPQSSLSTPLSDDNNNPSAGVSAPLDQRMPSLMDQLSKRTFGTNPSDYLVQNSYPIYPLSISPSAHQPPSTTCTETPFSH